jgi:hypothetical protein
MWTGSVRMSSKGRKQALSPNVRNGSKVDIAESLPGKQIGQMLVPLYWAGASSTGNVSWLDLQFGQPCLDADTSLLVTKSSPRGGHRLCSSNNSRDACRSLQ